jgi:hypothetical protein
MLAIRGNDFYQADLISGYLQANPSEKDPGGVCFRLAFKWLACKIYGRPFKTYSFNTGHNPEAVFKAKNVIKKQNQYLDKIKPYEGKKADYQQFLLQSNSATLLFINSWGNKAKEKYGTKYDLEVKHTVFPRLSRARRLFTQTANLIIGAYGSSSSGPWGHATAFYGPELRFFDANEGEFSFAKNEDIPSAIQTHLETWYAGYPKIPSYTAYSYGEGKTGNAKSFNPDEPLDQSVYYKINDYVLYRVAEAGKGHLSA